MAARAANKTAPAIRTGICQANQGVAGGTDILLLPDRLVHGSRRGRKRALPAKPAAGYG